MPEGFVAPAQDIAKAQKSNTGFVAPEEDIKRASLQPAPKQEKSAIPESVSNPLKSVQEKVAALPKKKEQQNHYARDSREDNQIVLSRVDEVNQELKDAQRNAAQLFSAKEATRDMFTSDEAFNKNKSAVEKDFAETQKKIRTLSGELGVLGREYYLNELKVETGKQYPSEIAEAQSLAEAAKRERLNKGGRLGFIYNGLLEGIGALSSAGTDAMAQIAVHMPGALGEGMTPEEGLKMIREEMEPGLRSGMKGLVGAEISNKKETQYNDEFIISAFKGLASSAPAMISPYGTGLFMQAYDSGLQSINETEKGKELPELTKTIFAGTVGTAQGFLENYGLSKIFGKTSDKVAQELSAKVMKELIGKSKGPITREMFETALEASVKTLKQRVIQTGKAGAIEFETGSLQELSTILAEKGTNVATGEQIFEPQSWGEMVGRVLYAGAQEAVGGFILGGGKQMISPSSARNYIAEKVASAKSEEDIFNLKNEIQSNVESGVLTSDEGTFATELVDKYAAIKSKIPDDVVQKKDVADLIIDREEVKEIIEEKKMQLETVDEAYKPNIEKEVELLEKRVKEINNEIVNPVEEVIEEVKPEPVKEVSRDEKLKQDFKNRSNTPNVKDLLEDRPETFDDVVATVKRGEETVPEQRAEVEQYIKDKEQLLAELKDNPERLFLSEDIQKAQDFIQKAKDILAVKEEKVAEPVVEKAKPVDKVKSAEVIEPVEEDKPLPTREQKAAEKVAAVNKEKAAEVSKQAEEKIESLKLKAKKYDDAEAADLEELKKLAAERKKIADKKKNLGIVAQGPEEAGKEMADELDNYVKTAKIYLRMGARKGVRTVEEFAEKIGEVVNDVIKKAFAQAKTEYDDERGYNKEQAGHYQTEGERIAAEQKRDEAGRVAQERDEFGLSDVKASIKLYDLFRTLDANKDNKGLFARTLQQGYAIIQKQDIPSDEKNFAYKEFKQMLMSAFEVPLTGNKQEDFDILEAQGFTVEDANFLTEEYDVLFFGDFTNGNEVNKVRGLYAPVNENGELVGLKDANGDIIPERKIYDMILDYSNSVKGFPENLTEFYSKMGEKSLANQLAKQTEADLVSLFNVFSSSKRKPFFYMSSFDGKLKLLPSNKERFDYSLVSALEEKVKKKYPAEVIKEKAAKFIEQKQALNAKNRAVQDKVGKLYAEFQKANLNKKYAEAEQIKQNILPLIKDIISNEAAFMEKITGISADMWIKGTNTQEVLSGVTGKGKGNVSTWMKNWIISAQTFPEFINKLIVKQGTFGLSQIDSLIKNVIKNPENTSLARNFTGIDGKNQNSDLFISYVDIALEDITSPEVQNNPKNKDNEFVKFFKDTAPQTAVFEGEKNDQDNDVATTNDIPTGDLLISMVQAFMDSMAKPTYMQFLEQQKDNASKVMVEAPTFKVDDKTQLLLEQNGLSAGIAAQVKFVQDKLTDFIMSSKGAEFDLKGRSTLDIAKAFTWNWALNKKFMDDYLQPETDTKGNKNYKNYQDKTKRSIDNKGYHLNSRILTEKLGRPNMNMVVLDDPRAVIKIAPSFSDDMKELADGTYFVRDKAEDAIKDASGSLLGISKSFKFTYTDHNQDNTRTFLKGHGITLTKELAEFNPTYKALYEYMENNDVDFLAFDSAVKKYDKAKQVKATWQNETHLAKEVPFTKENIIELNPKYLLVQQDLRQESTFDDGRVTRQQFYYAMRFKNYDKIQDIFNSIVKDKYADFKAEFVSKSEKEQKDFLKGLLTSGSDKYDLYRSFLSNKKSSLHSIYFQPIMRNILSGYVKKRIMSLDVNKQISIEAPLLGGFRDEKGKLHNLKSVRIEDGKIKPGQVLVPAAYKTQGFKKGDVIFISRVPSTELHSTTPLEIAGFLPESLGNIIMTDQGTRIGAGADYDGDMRHVWGKYKGNDGKDIMGDSYEGKINQVFDLMLEGYLGKALTGQELENQFTMITQPIDTGANKDMIKNHQERLAKDLSKDSIKSFLSQVESSQDGKRTIGIGARFNAIYALLEKHGASLRKEISFPGFTINKEGRPVENNKRITLSDFSHADFEKQHSIRSVLANFLNHSTDNPTLGNLEPMGINRYTTSLAYMLDALGMEEQQIYDYLNHPIVRNYVALARKYSSPYYKLSKQEVLQKLVDIYDEGNPGYNPTDYWNQKYRQLSTADMVATSGQGALNFISMLDYMTGIADSLTDLSQLEALANDPVVDVNEFHTMQEKYIRLLADKVNYNPNDLRSTNYLNNALTGLNSFNDFGKFYYPIMSDVGEQMYQEIRKASFIDPKVKAIIENRGLEDAMHQQFLINALDITESRAELAKKAKEVYDDMEETDPLKKLLKWDTKNNRLSVKEEYKHSLNESEKKEFRDEFEKLRGLASISDKFKGKIFGDLEEPWTILLNHQVKEYGWNPSPRSGEYASFMDVGTHAVVSDMMKQEFDKWNNGGVDDTRMGMMDAMVKQMQLRNTNLIPQVHYQDGVLMSAKNLEIKQGTGYVKIGQGETAKIYNLEDLLDGKKDNSYTLPKGKYEMLPIEKFENPIERIHTVQDAIDAQQKYAAPKTQGPKISLPTIKNKKEKYDIIPARKDAVKETREGYKITVKEFPNTKFYLTKSGKNWFVDDATTGFSMGVQRSTRDEALFAFQQIVNDNSGNEYSLNKMKTTGLFVENTNPVDKKYQGKIIYASPASGKTGTVQQLKTQGIEDVIDFDNLLAIQYNKVMAERTGNPSFDVATGDTVGKLIWNPKANDGRGAGAIRDWGSTDVQVSTQKAPVKVKNTTLNLYVPAIKEAQKLAAEGKTVLMGSKAWIKNSIPLGNGQTFDFEVDYAFPSSKEADTRMMEQREMTEYDLNKFREGEQSQIKSLPTEKVQDLGIQKIGEVILNKDKMDIKFEEEQSSGYAERTRKNASADATIAIAYDFNSAGEKLTKSSVTSQGKLYLPVSTDVFASGNDVDMMAGIISTQLNKLSKNEISLNIAGNGIYTLKGTMTQSAADNFTLELLQKVIQRLNPEKKIVSIRTGGQTGFDEAGAKAGIKLGIPTKILAPKGWKFRNINGQDISNEQQFKSRFNKSDNNNLEDDTDETINKCNPKK